MATYRTIRAPLRSHTAIGRYYAHHDHIVGPLVIVSVGYIDATGNTVVRQFRVVVRTDGHRFLNVTLARTGHCITRLQSNDWRRVGLTPGDKSQPRRLAQSALDRLTRDNSRFDVAGYLAAAEQAGPVCNPDILSIPAAVHHNATV